MTVDDETNHLLSRHYVAQNRMQLMYTGLMHEPVRYGYSEDQGVCGVREPGSHGTHDGACAGRPCRRASVSMTSDAWSTVRKDCPCYFDEPQVLKE